jgi:hypothetical protein
MLKLLGQYLDLAPAMISPPTSDEIDMSTLWHPDLHLDNIFVDPNTMEISSVLDWQSTVAAPFFSHCGVPKLVRHPEPVSLSLSDISRLPQNYEDLSQKDKEYADKKHNSKQLHQYYLQATRGGNPKHWAALQVQDDTRIQPVRIVQKVWDQNATFILRQALMRIVNNWERLCPGNGPCPVSFTDKELAVHHQERDSREFIYGLTSDGKVKAVDYDEMQAKLKRLRDSGFEAAENEEERFVMDKLWPFQDTVDAPSGDVSS